MTQVTIFRCGGRICGFNTKGHTGYAEAGQDIVCSAISALTVTAVNGLTEILGLVPAVESADGELYCMLAANTPDESLEKAEILLETMALGLRSIADTYGDYIRITEREV